MSFFASIIVPPLFIAVCLAFTLVVPDLDKAVPLDLQFMMYENSTMARLNNVTTFISKDLDDESTNDLYNSLTGKPGFGTWCSETKRNKMIRDETVNRALDKYGIDNTKRDGIKIGTCFTLCNVSYPFLNLSGS
jgi:hypothetical protein